VEASRRFALVFFFRDGFRERGFLAGSDEEEEDRLIHRLLRNDCEGLHEVETTKIWQHTQIAPSSNIVSQLQVTGSSRHLLP
jgi:hypothetical protein